jgi:predicted Abi (CAAX) family protease
MFATRCRSSEAPIAANVSITSPSPTDLYTVQVTNASGHSDSEFDVPIPTIQISQDHHLRAHPNLTSFPPSTFWPHSTRPCKPHLKSTT